MKKISQEWIGLLLLSVVSGGVAGFVGGMWGKTVVTMQTPARPVATSTTPTIPVPQVSTTTFSVVPAEHRAPATVAPPAFAARGMSALATLYRKPKTGTTIEERELGPDRLLGQAIALTSDGWFVTTASVFEGLHPSDVVLWHDGASYAIERAVHDQLNDTVFFKTEASGLNAPAFAHLTDLSSASQVWLESRPAALSPRVILDLSARTSPNDAASSEWNARRILLSGTAAAGDRGGAAWDPNGALIGLLESKAGEGLRLVPASSIGSSFASLLAYGEIRHASLGIHAIDLASLRMDAPRGTLPKQGAWIRDEKKSSTVTKTKLHVDDVILRVERDIIDGTADLGEILSDYRPGVTVSLRIVRNGSDQDVPVTLGTVVTGEVLK